jgi:hemerythrin superfamily protein
VRLGAIKDRLAKHNHLEEEVVYPLQQSMSASDRVDLSRSIAKELANVPPRFSKNS